MSGTPFEPDGRRRSGGTPRGAPAAPWGVGGTLLGILATLFLSILTAAALTLVLGPADTEAMSAGERYLMISAFELILIVVPIGAAIVTGAGPAALGLTRYRLRGLGEGLLLGGTLVAVSMCYSLSMKWLSPELYERMQTEQQQQLRLLDGPLPLLLLFVLVIAPLGEELFFRGFVFTGLRGRLGFALASGLSAALFALAHVMPLSMPVLFAVGLGTAAMLERHGSLAICLVTHATFNLVSLLLSGFE